MCIQCGLRIHIVELLNQSTDVSNDSEERMMADSDKDSKKDSTSSPTLHSHSHSHSKVQQLNLNLLSPNDFASHRSHSTRSNTSLAESEMSQCSVHTATSQEERRFVCHFHGQNIVSKHHTKNKFYCNSCQVNPEYVFEYNYSLLEEDLT